MVLLGHKPRENGRQSKADRERHRRELWERTKREVDAIWARYDSKFKRRDAESIGAIYARYSTRHQDSIADQVRKILEEAIRLKVYVPREFIFFDLAIRGFTKHRQGLDAAQRILKQKQAGTLLLFATNRLFRKVYRTLEFVDRVHKGWGIRCVFIKSGVDTNDEKRWEMILHTQSMVDQFVVTMYVDNIRASHEGLLEKRLVFGTLSFGYRGDPIPGLTTVHGKPRCQIVTDPLTSKVVKQIFQWYVEEKISINEIIRRLNVDDRIPLPPRSTSGAWTRLAVRRLLTNTRYRGVWQYGVTESYYVPDGDYTRQKLRMESLKEVVLEELRMIDDETWFAAQTRLAKECHRNGGRKPSDGNRRSRPRLLNGLFYCPEHERPLQVGGANGRSMHCPRCLGVHAKERPLYSQLNRVLALKLTCSKLAELVRSDAGLAKNVIAACQRQAEEGQKPDPERLQQLRSREQQLHRAIEFNQRNPGDSEGDQAATLALIRELRQERNEILHEIAVCEKARERKISIPNVEEVLRLLEELERILMAAADGNSDEDAGNVREIIDLLTGGHIDLCQMGERAPKRGWLQGRFRCDLVTVLAAKVSGVQPSGEGHGLKVVIDYKRELLIDEQSEKAFRLYEQGKLGKQIALAMKRSDAYVSMLLDRAYAKRGLDRPDGRRRRKSLDDKQDETPVYKQIAEEVTQLVQEGWSDLGIARYFRTSDFTVSRAIAYYFKSRGLPIPSAADRRRMKLERAKQMYEDGMLIKDIAPLVGYSARGLKLALKKLYAELGEAMPDGRSRRGNARSGQKACGHAARKGQSAKDS